MGPLLNVNIIQPCLDKHNRYQPIVGRNSDDDSCHNEESDEESDNKYGPDGGARSGMVRAPASSRPHHLSQLGTFAPTIPLSPKLSPGREPIIVVQYIDTRNASIMAFMHMITSPVPRGAAKR